MSKKKNGEVSALMLMEGAMPSASAVSCTMIKNGPATVCLINEGSKRFKGVSKCMPGDTYNEQKGIQIAVAKAQLKRQEWHLKQLVK